MRHEHLLGGPPDPPFREEQAGYVNYLVERLGQVQRLYMKSVYGFNSNENADTEQLFAACDERDEAILHLVDYVQRHPIVRWTE